MRIFLLLAPCYLVALGCLGSPAADAPVPSSAADIDSDVEKPQFVFSAPEGFKWNEDHQLWHNEVMRTSIRLAHDPSASFDNIVDDFESDRMLAANMELVSKDIRDVAGRPTMLVRGNRLNAKYPQQFCTVAFSTKVGCAQITAMYPKSMNEEMKQQIENALLAARHEPAT